MDRPDDPAVANNWLGSYYELAIDLGPRDQHADDRVQAAIRTLWGHPTLDGCHYERPPAIDAAPRLKPEDLRPSHSCLYGWATTPLGRIVCLTHIVREDGDDGTDWLDLCIPTSALGLLEPRLSFPIAGDESRAWRLPLDESFAEIARQVAEAAPFGSRSLARRYRATTRSVLVRPTNAR